MSLPYRRLKSETDITQEKFLESLKHEVMYITNQEGETMLRIENSEEEEKTMMKEMR